MEDKPSDQDIQNQLNRLVSAINNTYYNRRLLLTNSFLSGLFSGIGATLGVALVVVLIGYLVRHFGGLPVIGHWLNSIGNAIQKRP